MMLHKYAIKGIFICFYIWLNLKERDNFEIKIKDILGINFLEYQIKLQEELVNNIIFDKGIAPNNIWKLNIFISFIGILTKIAVFLVGLLDVIKYYVFLVGPPGCYKILCLNLLKPQWKE